MTTWLFDPGTADLEPRDVLDITLRFDDAVTVCLLDGPLSAFTAPTLRDWLAELHRNERHHVIVDAAGVTALSTEGVEVLVDHAARCRDAGGRLQVRAPWAVTRRVLVRCDAAFLLTD